MRKRLAAVCLSAALALTGGGAVACGDDNDNKDEVDEIIDEGQKELNELEKDIEDNN